MKALLQKIWAKIKAIFAKVDEETKLLLPEIIQVVTNIDNFVDSPGCDFLTSVIPGTIDDTVQKLLKQYLPKLLDILNKVESIAVIEDPNDRMKAIVKEIQTYTGDLRDITLQPMAGKLIQAATTLPWGDSVKVAQTVFEDPAIVL